MHSSRVLHRVARDRPEHTELGRRRSDRERPQQLPRLGAQASGACEHGIPDGRRDLRAARRQHLRDEERVPAGAAIELLRVDLALLGKLCDRASRQPRDIQTLDASGPNELTKYDAQRMGAAKLVVAISGHHQGTKPINATAKQPQDIERRLVRPVQILKHQHRR
jgi:hypothetical protein